MNDDLIRETNKQIRDLDILLKAYHRNKRPIPGSWDLIEDKTGWNPTKDKS